MYCFCTARHGRTVNVATANPTGVCATAVGSRGALCLRGVRGTMPCRRPHARPAPVVTPSRLVLPDYQPAGGYRRDVSFEQGKVTNWP